MNKILNDMFSFDGVFKRKDPRHGIVTLKLDNQQKEVIIDMVNNEDTVMSIAPTRQIGSSVMMCYFFLSNAIIRPNTSYIFLGKGNHIYHYREMVDQLLNDTIFKHFIKYNNRHSIEFVNGSKIFFKLGDVDVLKGYSVDMLFIENGRYDLKDLYRNSKKIIINLPYFEFKSKETFDHIFDSEVIQMHWTKSERLNKNLTWLDSDGNVIEETRYSKHSIDNKLKLGLTPSNEWSNSYKKILGDVNYRKEYDNRFY